MTFLILFILQFTFQQPDYILEFSKVDNRINVYINDKLYYEGKEIDGNPELGLEVSLNAGLQKGNNTIKVDVFNGSSLTPYIEDKHWEIRYELMVDGESFEFVHEWGNDGVKGLAHSSEFYIDF